jgi:hypothetical protein
MTDAPTRSIRITGTVEDVLKVYGYVDENMQKQLFDSVRGNWRRDAPVHLDVDGEDTAKELIRLSKLASAPVRTITVRSDSRAGVYHTVSFRGGMPVACSCEAFKFSDSNPCRHINAVIVRGLRPRDETSTE